MTFSLFKRPVRISRANIVGFGDSKIDGKKHLPAYFDES